MQFEIELGADLMIENNLKSKLWNIGINNIDYKDTSNHKQSVHILKSNLYNVKDQQIYLNEPVIDFLKVKTHLGEEKIDNILDKVKDQLNTGLVTLADILIKILKKSLIGQIFTIHY